jgi:polar amino acid transport system substrate-binding protein
MKLSKWVRRQHVTKVKSLIAGVAVGLSGALTDAGAADPVTKIAVEGIFPPFNYLDSKNQLQGFDVEIANALCERAKLTCEFVVQDWDGMIPNLLEKKYDAIVSSMSMSAERKEKVAFTDRYYDSPSVFVVQTKSKITATDAEGLTKSKLGVTLSTSQASYADDHYKHLERVVYPSSPDLYKALQAGEVDVILEDKLAIYDWLTNTKAGQCCEFRGPDVKDVTYFGEGAGIAVRPDDRKLLATLNEALKDIQADGSYDQINAKYFPFSIR